MLKKELLCKLPIQFLQDNLYGIMTGDMIMIAAGTSVGKSTLSRLLLHSADEQDQPAVLFSLEDEPGTFVTDSVYREYLKTTFNPLNLRPWMLDYTTNPEKYENFCRIAALNSLRKSKDGINLMKVYEMKAPNWSEKEVIDEMLKCVSEGYKFFILDHIDVLVPSEEARDMVATIGNLWKIVAEKQICLITFSQLSSKRNKEALCPGIDDLRGSKSKVFTPTIVLSIARHNYEFYSDIDGSPTYCRILKNRQGGTQKAAVIYYNKGKYIPKYKEVSCNESGTTIDGETQNSLSKLQRAKDD